jgi:outer membrane protein assembly factor BamB
MRRNRFRVAAICVVAVGLAGCFWPAPGAGPGRTAHNVFETEITSATVAGLRLVWSVHGDGAMMDNPVTSVRGVHAFDYKGFYAFSFETGARLWTTRMPTDFPAQTGPVVADGDRVVIGYHTTVPDQWTTTFEDAATGADLGSGGVAPGLVDGLEGDILLTRSTMPGSATPTVVRMNVSNLASPASSWSAAIDVSSLGETRALTLGRTRIYQAGRGVATPSGSTNAVRSYAVATPPAPCPPPTPAGFGCPLWATDIAGTTASPPVVDPSESVIYTGTDTGAVYALDAATGAILWTTTGVGRATGDSPALADGSLYVPTTDGFFVLDATTGAIRWTAPLGSVSTQPAVAGGVVFTGGLDGRVMAFDAAGCGADTCSPLWSVSTGFFITGLAVSQGRLYVATSDGRLESYGLP